MYWEGKWAILISTYYDTLGHVVSESSWVSDATRLWCWPFPQHTVIDKSKTISEVCSSSILARRAFSNTHKLQQLDPRWIDVFGEISSTIGHQVGRILMIFQPEERGIYIDWCQPTHKMGIVLCHWMDVPQCWVIFRKSTVGLYLSSRKF